MSDISLSKAVRSNLLSLQSTATMMAKTQERLATGNKVNSALDNPSNFFTASALNSRAGDLNALIDGMANGVKTLEAADNGLTSITKTLESMQSTLRQARQDKSFQVSSFDVTADSKLTIAGGTLPAGVDIELADPFAGKKAAVTSTAAYTGPALGATVGGGARAEITWNATMDGTTDVVSVDGIGLDLSAAPITDSATAATAIQTQLNSAAANTYSVTEAAGVIKIEKLDSSAASPAVSLGTSAAVSGTAKFTFDPARMGSTINVDGTDVTVEATLTGFTSALQTGLGDDYTVTADADTNEVTIKANTPGLASTPVVTGGNLGATAANATFTLSNTKAQALSIGGTELLIEAGASDADVIAAFEADAGFDADYAITSDGAGKFEVTAKNAGAGALAVTSDARAQTAITLDTTASQDLTIGGLAPITIGAGLTQAQSVAALNANGAFSAAYEAKIDGANISIISKTAGAAAANGPTVTSTVGAQLTGVTPTNVAVDYASPVSAVVSEAGKAAVAVTTGNGVNGATVANFTAPTDKLTVTYGNKTVNLDVTRGTQDEMLESINGQLEAAGVAVEAKFDATGKLGFEATSAEAKTLAVSGAAAGSIFGANSVAVGEDAVQALNATKAVDKFVELINRDHGTSIRASNDNGRLRLENLSTAAMTVISDKDGAGAEAATNATIGGNTVREGLASQFNELKDQLNKLSDDASFNGINLLRGDQLTITFNETGNSFMQIKAASSGGINSESLKIADLIGSDFDKDADIDNLLGGIKTALNSVRAQSSAFGSNLSIVQNRQDFTKSMINTLETGAANLTLADMNEEAANLLALQTRQSLSSSTLSMASQADQSVLQLLR